MGSAVWRHRFSDSSPKSQSNYIDLLLSLPELGPDYLNKEQKNVLIINRAFSARAGKVISLVLKPQAHASQINDPNRTSPHITQSSKSRRAEEGRETRGEPDPGLDAVSESGRHEDSSSSPVSWFKSNLLL